MFSTVVGSIDVVRESGRNHRLLLLSRMMLMLPTINGSVYVVGESRCNRRLLSWSLEPSGAPIEDVGAYVSLWTWKLDAFSCSVNN